MLQNLFACAEKSVAILPGAHSITSVIHEPLLENTEILRAAGPRQRKLHEKAMEAAARFGGRVFLRGVVEVSNYCRENCAYCGMRRSNRNLHRFRARYEQLAGLLVHHRPQSITDLNIQTGEDPVAVRELVLPLVRLLRRETPLGISVCLGTLEPSLYAELREAGAALYIMKFEMANPELYARMQAPGTLPERLNAIRHLASAGWKVSSGFIAGLPGQTERDLLDNIRQAQQLPLDGCSVSPFIPGDETPLACQPAGDVNLTLNCMAVLRILRPDWIIPSVSALNLAEPGTGYGRGLRTGANLVTINLTPSELREDYLLYKRERFIMTEERILSAIAAENRTPSSQSLVQYFREKDASPSAAIVA